MKHRCLNCIHCKRKFKIQTSFHLITFSPYVKAWSYNFNLLRYWRRLAKARVCSCHVQLDSQPMDDTVLEQLAMEARLRQRGARRRRQVAEQYVEEIVSLHVIFTYLLLGLISARRPVTLSAVAEPRSTEISMNHRYNYKTWQNFVTPSLLKLTILSFLRVKKMPWLFFADCNPTLTITML